MSLIAKVEIYNSAKQTKKDEHGNKYQTVANIVRETDTVSVNEKWSIEKQKDFVIDYAIFTLASRYRSFVETKKNLPSTLFVKVTIGGEIFRSETVVVKTKMENLLKVSMKGLKSIPISQVIPEVMEIHRSGLKSAGSHLARKANYLNSLEKGEVTAPLYEGFNAEPVLELN